MREFGFVIPERSVVVDDVRVRGTGCSGLRLEDVAKTQTGPPRVDKVSGPAMHPHLCPQGHGGRWGWGGWGRCWTWEPPSPHTSSDDPVLL